ncbi:thioesterase family protein [Bosea sp. PAMC 26642]|uniref:thioesterase family protein n=1 Tax=Bosea sp. (strain PAMC 26642) TaxID=1792307 RepID=UPI0007704B05|nr:thioesterase family protein [Bosea sp. PAMC 26642]AMJ59107.1 thioesterase [Bosea sp. PAMC 26642]
MNLWFRLLWLLLATPFRPRLVAPFAPSVLRFRVWFNDLDTSPHMNNGRYWTLMDLGRTDLMLRSGLWRAVLRHRWLPVVNAGTIRFRRELRLFRPFRVETKILCWTQSWLVMQHRVLSRGRDGAEIVAAVALVRAALYDKRERSFVPVARLLGEIGRNAESPPQSPEVAAFLASEDALRAAAPSSDA